MKKCISIILILVIISSFTACKNKSDEELYNYSGTIITYMYTPDFMNPLATAYKTNAQVLSMMYSPLFNVKSDLTVEPVVAEKYGFLDSTTLEVTLKSDFTFTDGTVLSASDVIASLDYLKKFKKNMYHGIFDYVESYYKGVGNTITFKLKKGGSSVIPFLDFPIVKGGNKKIGSGPYRYVSRDNDCMIMTANKTSKTQTKTKTIKAIIYAKEKMQNSAFVNNEINVVNSDIYDLAQFSSKKNTNIKEYTSDYFTFLGFNNEKITDINIKKAIAYTIDKDDLTSTVLVGHALKTASPYRPNTIYDTTQNLDYKKNTDKAKEFINEDFELHDIKEGELSVSALWQSIYGDEKPLPEKLDFRMHK